MFLDGIPIIMKYIYKTMGIIQFGATTQPIFFKITPHLWSIPINSFFVYLGIQYNAWYFDFSDFTIVRFIDSLAIFSSTITMALCAFIFCYRSSHLSTLLTELDNLKIPNEGKPLPRDVALRIGAVGSMIINIICHFVEDELPIPQFFFSLPGIITFFDHLFLGDVLNMICNKFETINVQLQRQVNSVDLSKIFPLTKMSKIQLLKDEEIDFNLERVHELSHYHYDLVGLTKKISYHFEITTIAAMLTWFGYVNDSCYYIIDYGVKDEATAEFYATNFSFLIFYLFWLILMLKMFTRTQNKVADDLFSY